jgi:hypothetical protein
MESLHPNSAIPNEKKEDALNRLRERAKSRGAQHLPTYEEIRNVILDILYESMYSGDVTSAIASVKKNKLIDGIEFTKRALIFGIEKQSYERELISKLLSASYELFNDNEIIDGFQLLLYRLPDLTLDVPHAPQFLSKFIVRAVYDEIVPPIFIKNAHIDNPKAKECMSLAYALTHSVEDKSRREHVWGPADMTSVNALKSAVDGLLDEYLDNPDIKEATVAIKELNAPSFFGQVINRGIFKTLSKNTEKAKKDFMELLVYWFKLDLITEGHVKRGFAMAFLLLDDMKLDIPTALTGLPDLKKEAIEKKLLPANFVPILGSLTTY